MVEPLVFFQSKYHAWHFSTVRDWAIYDLPEGARYQTINAPGAGNLKRWLRTQWRVGRHFNKALRKYERVYFVEYTKEADEMPLLDGESVVETFGIENAITIK